MKNLGLKTVSFKMIDSDQCGKQLQREALFGLSSTGDGEN
jgi:hypothetical protein